jgi:hypothetical protein
MGMKMVMYCFFMKELQPILALIALVALILPCTHAEEHHHHEMAGVELCSIDHADCQCDSTEPCSKPEPLVENVLVVGLSVPVRKIELIYVLETHTAVSLPTFRPLGDLLHLQTVQLLI